jgi:hypothetical protein
MDPESAALEQIEALERDLQSAKLELRCIRLSRKRDGKPVYRFYKVRPGNAAVILIKEHSKKMTKKELENLILAGGYSLGIKKPSSNIRIAFEESVISGKLIEKDDYLDIPR